MIPVLTIDGPSGSGKGAVGWAIAQAKGWHFLDSGAIYRLLALSAMRKGVALDDEAQLLVLAENLQACFDRGESSSDHFRIFLENMDVTDVIRTEETGAGASKVASLGAVRMALLARQRAFCQAPGLVADGRDMGTVVFPEAQAKVFITASAEERANRRVKQLKHKGLDANLAQILADIQARDERDSKRAVSPLLPAEDAILIDTTEMPLQDVVAQVLDLVNSRFPTKS